MTKEFFDSNDFNGLLGLNRQTKEYFLLEKNCFFSFENYLAKKAISEKETVFSIALTLTPCQIRNVNGVDRISIFKNKKGGKGGGVLTKVLLTKRLHITEGISNYGCFVEA